MRRLVAIITGIFTAMLLIALVENLGHRIWPPPADLDPRNADSVRAAMARMSTGTLTTVAMAWVIGTFGGGWLAARFSHQRRAAYFVGGLVMAASIANLMSFPHPAWFWIVALVIVPATSHLAGTIGARAVPGSDAAGTKVHSSPPPP